MFESRLEVEIRVFVECLLERVYEFGSQRVAVYLAMSAPCSEKAWIRMAPFPFVVFCIERLPVARQVAELLLHISYLHVSELRNLGLHNPPLVVVIGDADRMRQVGSA